jgi:phosphomannomutase
MNNTLRCFTAYDIRGRNCYDVIENVAYHAGRVVAQYLTVKSTVVRYDARATRVDYAAVAGRGARNEAVEILAIGMAGAEEMYWTIVRCE